MKTELVQTLTTTFEAHAQQTETGVEYWLARDLQDLLGNTEWRNFTAVIAKAETACEVSGHAIPDHFVEVNKTIQMPKSAEKEVPDLNNQAVRKTLLERGIRPETLPAAEDVKKVERRLASEEKKSLNIPDALPPEE
jgi:hypothetical protein